MSTLLQLRTEVLATGFAANVWSARIDSFINDAQYQIARTVEWYGEEGIYVLPLVNATTTYAWPADMAKIRSVFALAADPSPNRELQRVALQDIDRSPASSGHPWYYAVDGPNLHFWPTPDSGTYSLELRYWKLPPLLVNDSDVPTLPADYHSLLVWYALARCYERDDDTQMAQYHDAKFIKAVAGLHTELVFPSTEEPRQVRGMWQDDVPLSVGGPGSWLWGQ